MHPSLFPLAQRFPAAQLAYLGAIGLWSYAVVTIELHSYGLLNFATWLAVGTFLVAAPTLRALSRRWWTTLETQARTHGLRLPLVILGVGLATLAAVRFAIRLQIGGDFVGITPLIWSLGCVALVAAAWPQELGALRAWLHTHTIELRCVVALTFAAGVLRFWRLGAVPNIINGDEGLIGVWAQDIGHASGTLTTPFAAMDGVGTIYLAVMQGVFTLLGPTTFALRLLPAIAGTLAIPATYLLTRSLLGVRAAWVAASLLALSHVHIHFSRTVAVSYIYATLFVPLALYFLLSGLERRSSLRLTLAAVMVGIHINIYVDGWVWLVLLGLLLAAWAVVDRHRIWASRGLLAYFGLVTGLIMAPMVIWGFQSPDAFSSRLAVDGTFSSGWLAHEAVATGNHPVWIVAELFAFALGTFTLHPFADFYGIRVPTLDPVTGVLWVIGLALALWRTRSPRMLLLNGWFWGGVVALGVVTIPPSTYHYRLLVVLPAACILAALALETACNWLARLPLVATLQHPYARDVGIGTLVVLILIIGRLNFATYYETFASSCVYHGPATRQAGLLGNALHPLPRDTTVVVLPNEYGFRYGPQLSVDFLSGRMTIRNIDAPLGAVRPSEFTGELVGGLVVAAVPERRAELTQVRAWFPDGVQQSILDCGKEALVLYEWWPAQRR
jgi:hypothetical protein